MSYTLKTKCGTCKKNIKCIDSTFVQMAINGIHTVNYDNVARKELHLGAGSIEIQCHNFVDNVPEELPNK